MHIFIKTLIHNNAQAEILDIERRMLNITNKMRMYKIPLDFKERKEEISYVKLSMIEKLSALQTAFRQWPTISIGEKGYEIFFHTLYRASILDRAKSFRRRIFDLKHKLNV